MINDQPVILCSPRIRLPLFKLLVRHIPTVVVMLYSEVTTATDVNVEELSIIGGNNNSSENIVSFRAPINNSDE